MNVVSMDTVSMGMVSTDKNFNTLLCACMILSSQVCVYVQWYLQTNTVAFISAPLSGPLSHEQTYRTQIPRRWKNPLLLGQEVQRLQWWGHHSRSGTRVWDWSVTTELKDTGTPFRCKLCIWGKKASFGCLHAITWTAVMENKHKPFVFHLHKTIFALRHIPTQKHAHACCWHTSGGQLQWEWNRGQCLWPFGLPHHGNTSSCTDVAAGLDLHTHTHKLTWFKAT